MKLFQLSRVLWSHYFATTPLKRLLHISVLIMITLLEGCDNERVQPPVLPDDNILRPDFPRFGLTSEYLKDLKTKTSTPEWTNIFSRMTQMVSTGELEYGFGAYHLAVAFAVTGDKKFAKMSKQEIFRIMDEPGYCDLTSTYLRAPDCVGQVALATDILFNQLTDQERNKVFDYLENIARDIVEVRGWSGWGWVEGNPDYHQLNNYYPGHLETLSMYALLAYNHRALAREYFKLIVDHELPAALELMKNETVGGHGSEGTWYDDKLFGHYCNVVLMIRQATQGRIDFGKEYAGVFADYAKFRLYSFNPTILQNGKPQLYHLATGDQPAVEGAMVIDLARLRLWKLMDVLKGTSESGVRGYIKFFEDEIDFEAKGWQREYLLYYLLHFDQNVPAIDYTKDFANSWFAAGKGLAHFRTGWDNDDMTVSIHFSRGLGQRGSHWHFGEGAFYIWYNGWQADHLNRVEGSGVRQNTALMNTILVNNDENSQGQGDASVLFFKGGDSYMAVKGQATELYKGRLNKFERTFLVTGQKITVYDNIHKKTPGDDISFLLNNENGFTIKANEPGYFTAENLGGRLSVKPMTSGSIHLIDNRQLRLNYTANDQELHLLHALEVGKVGTSASNMLPLDTDNATCSGVQFINSEESHVHIINKSDSKVSALSYTASFGNGSCYHLISGMAAGTYIVKKDNVGMGQVSVAADGVLYFQSASGGTFTINK